ncbi:virion structural protein [Synechococcus phage S-H9-2]|uniref:Virion structural protein n=1 Tax=Synechococcus phage S-H9-2 TaxID=2783669 RepID=A0A873WHG1_9CAUD|nr:virion structural protein [Synechococcus phage S-H9-2]QPB08402.1 virion structural protein [Synechococcus phage S-H9-2]
MARKSIKSNYYLFDASEREVVIPGGIQREQLILITNVTDNKVIYNFSDPELIATEYHISTDIRNNTTTRIVLAYDTTSMSDTDKLQIVYDDFVETVQPDETYHDAVNKAKVSTPQSQIDTDFEYGTQDTKWESLAMINNNPFAYKSETPIAVTQIEAFEDERRILVSVDTGVSPQPDAGVAIYVQDTIFDGANGVFIIDKQVGNNQFEYTAKYQWSTGDSSIQDSARTAVYTGIHYTGSEIGTGTGGITLAAQADGSILVSCDEAHGLEVGNEIAVVGSNGTNVNGSWIVARVTSPSDFYYFPIGTPSGSVNTGTIKVYPRPQGSSVHRAFDGGVKFSTNSNSKNQQCIRQTKRYFRYQSGKGVAFSTGSILAPAIENIDQITASGTTVTVVAAVPHNLTTSTIVDVRNCNDNLYNGEYQVSEVVNAYTFKYIASSAPTETTASGEYTITPINSYGTNLEIGMMDQQNGIFFRYGNGKLSVVRRSSTFQLSGKATVTAGSTVVSSYSGPNQENTKFSKQLKPGDYIVLRGSSYRVDGIISDTQLVIFPDYRGPSGINVPITKTVETEWEQSEWNLDRMDGTGKSGYTIDVTKMQMFYMDYSWYGAGFIRWGFRALDGNVIYVHKIPNNNQNTEAYMRSGNLPARYEVNTIPPSALVYKDIATGSTEIYTDTAPDKFPTSGTLRVRQTTAVSPNFTANIEYINYDSVTTFKQDVTSIVNNNIFVSNTGGIVAGGVQPVTFDRPISNIVAGKRYWVASKTTNSFQITDIAGSGTGIALTNDETGSALSPLAVVESGKFSSLTREKAGELSGINLTIADGASTATVTSSANLQIGQRVVGTGIDADTFVSSIPSGTSVKLSKAVTAANPTGVKFIPMSNGTAQAFTYSASQPTTAELLSATSVPQISHWGSSVIMDGRLDDDRAYVYTVGTKTGRSIAVNDTKAIIALRVAPSVDNGITGPFGTRELTNRMQLVMDGVSVSASKTFFIEILLNPTISSAATWLDVGGTSLAQYAILGTNSELVGGEVIFGFYAEGSSLGAATNYDLSKVKEISNSILGGGGSTLPVASGANPTGVFPDGPEVLAVRATCLGGGFGQQGGSIDTRFSWTEAQA